jgi:hypothetical protein
MRHRNEYYSTWHYPPELVASFWCFIAFTLASSAASVFLELPGSSRGAGWIYIGAVVVSMGCGLVFFAVTLPVFWAAFDVSPQLSAVGELPGAAAAAFVSGCGVGAGVTAARYRITRRGDAM